MNSFEDIIIQFPNNTSNLIATWLPPLLAFIGVVLTVLINFFQNKKNNQLLQKQKVKELEVNVISKARIKWIEEMRDIVSEMVAISYRVDQEQKKYLRIKNKASGISDKLSEMKLKIREDVFNYNALRAKSNLYLSSNTVSDKGEKVENKENIEFKNHIRDFSKQLIEIANTKNIDEYDKEIQSLRDKREELLNYASDYLKNEWDKVKNINL